MVRGTATSIDPITGFPKVVVVRVGKKAKEEHVVFEPLLSDPSVTPIVDRRTAKGRTPKLADSRVLEVARRTLAEKRARRGVPVRCEWRFDESTGSLSVDSVVPERSPADAVGSRPGTQTRLLVNLADPAAAWRAWNLPADGVALVRLELVIGAIGKHPLVLSERKRRRLVHAVARIAAAFHPKPVVVRLSDFESSEAAELSGGRRFEPPERNPMLGRHGASRLASADYGAGLALECDVVRIVRERIGLRNVELLVPFVRTLDEADRITALLAAHGLERGREGLALHVMCEVPANVLVADELAQRFDGVTLGTNDLTQLMLGIDRNNPRVSELFDEADPAVLRAIEHVVRACRVRGVPVTACGHRASRDPAFCRRLVQAGVDAIGVDPESFHEVARVVAAVEAERLRRENGRTSRNPGEAQRGELQ